jgi:DNA primase
MSLPDSFLNEIRSRVPVSGVAQRRVKLSRKGHEWSGLCPFHNEKSPSFTVSDDKEFFHCFGCGAHGDVIAFVMRSQHLDFMAAVEDLAAEAGLVVPALSAEAAAQEQHWSSLHALMEKACSWFVEQFDGAAGEAARDYIASRGISDESCQRFRIGFAPSRGGVKDATGAPLEQLIELGLVRKREDGSTHDMFRNRVIFPITDKRGRVIAFGGRVLDQQTPKYLNSPASPIFDKGSTLFGHAHAREAAGRSGRVCVVEGYLDVIAMHQGGIADAVAPLGTALTEMQIEELWRLASGIVICFDADGAGRKAAEGAAERGLKMLTAGRMLYFARLGGGKDPAELFAKGEGLQVTEAIGAALPLSDALWEMLQARIPDGTPEQAAMFEKSLYAAASEIPDPLIRARVLGEFRRRLRWQWDDPPRIFIGRSQKRMAPLPSEERLHLIWSWCLASAKSLNVDQWLAKKGLDLDAVASALGGVGMVRAKLVKGRYDANCAWPDAPAPALWDYGGEEGLVVFPLWEGAPGSDLLDLVGWNPRTGALASSTGHAVVLNPQAIAAATGFEARGLAHGVKVAETPLSWLRKMAGGENAVFVVDWRRVWDALGGVQQLEAESVELGEMLDKHIKPPRLRRPTIRVEARA